MKVEINISKARFVVLLIGILLVGGGFLVYAYNAGFSNIAADAATFGHSSDEVVLRLANGELATLQDYLINTQPFVLSGDDALGAPLVYTVNNVFNTNPDPDFSYICLNDIDLEEYCGDDDGCVIRVVANRKTDDYVTVTDFSLYAEQESFSNKVNVGFHGYTSSALGVISWIVGDAARSLIFDSPSDWVQLVDYRHSYCSGNNNLVYADPFKFTLLVPEAIRAKMIVYDSYSIKEPVQISSTPGLPSDVYIFAIDDRGENEGCSYEVNYGGCGDVHSFRTSGEWNYNVCHTQTETQIETDCPSLGDITINWNVDDPRLGDILGGGLGS